MPSSKRLRKQMAKIEYAACRDTVDAMLAQDFNPKLIHEKLTEEGRFTMAYTSFTQILRNAGKDIPPAKAAPAPAENRKPSPALPQRQPGIIRAETKTFPDPRTMNPNDSF
jgi:hypothetical protein